MQEDIERVIETLEQTVTKQGELEKENQAMIERVQELEGIEN
jgi:hypothetical protein